MKKRYKLAVLLALALGLGTTLTACGDHGDEATPTSACAYRLGDGKDGRTADIKNVYFPGQVIHRDQDSGGNNKDVVKYFPCNARDFIVNDGTQLDANGHKVGDVHKLTQGTTKEGTKVLIGWTAYWTLNQTKDVLENDFYPFCAKYNCFTSEANASDTNYASKGWNGMLGENFEPAGEQVIGSQSKATLSDASWQDQDRDEWKTLATAASNGFADAIRQSTGYQDDLFCGSGNSGWSNPRKPGEGNFTCTNVRFVVTSVVPLDSELSSISQEEKKATAQSKLNTDLLNAAKNKYGDDASYFLGLQDTIEKCADAHVNCVVSLGGGSAPNVTLPVTGAQSSSGKK